MLDALRAGLDTPQAMVPRIYRGLDEGLYPAAALSLTAHLLKLVKEGRAAGTGGVYRLTV